MTEIDDAIEKGRDQETMSDDASSVCEAGLESLSTYTKEAIENEVEQMSSLVLIPGKHIPME
jgi:hypothetical protein